MLNLVHICQLSDKHHRKGNMMVSEEEVIAVTANQQSGISNYKQNHPPVNMISDIVLPISITNYPDQEVVKAYQFCRRIQISEARIA